MLRAKNYLLLALPTAGLHLPSHTQRRETLTEKSKAIKHPSNGTLERDTDSFRTTIKPLLEVVIAS